MIIVTGGAGFIGSNIVKELNRQGRSDILIVDDLNNRKEQSQSYRNLRGLQFIDYMHKDDFLTAIQNKEFDLSLDEEKRMFYLKKKMIFWKMKKKRVYY